MVLVPAGVLPRLDVVATPLAATLGLLPIYQLSVVLYRGDGTMATYSARPELPAPPYGRIVVEKLRRPPPLRAVGLPPITVTLAAGDAAHRLEPPLDAAAGRINGKRERYAPLGPNSNTVARSLLVECGVPGAHPSPVAPGFDFPLL